MGRTRDQEQARSTGAMMLGEGSYNLSSKPADVAAYDTGRLTADSRGLIQERGAESALLAGHDWGGTVAWATAMNHPEVQLLTDFFAPALPAPSR